MPKELIKIPSGGKCDAPQELNISYTMTSVADATTVISGKIAIATQVEVDSGLDNNKAVTPVTLKTFITGYVDPSADSAMPVDVVYDQTSVQAILDELRDLKIKMRTSGILAV